MVDDGSLDVNMKGFVFGKALYGDKSSDKSKPALSQINSGDSEAIYGSGPDGAMSLYTPDGCDYITTDGGDT
eukprot:CAMPEP_0201572952 /NCGR_PEP_ID=MMETSP0190_2-20130828/16536_1 /ASSEMBLY_ACC=CAM_ASM_000263 /TAXON_ID=37353 /ORGANISM="Rosalina sp." /LENGTH=71 /DNA_ID=CAMNT_0047999351 /DNA_START=1 /DNA_END=212 /DNA_ORIENTATION=+